MKKFLPLFLIVLLTFTACNPTRITLNPSGLPPQSTATEDDEHYETDDYMAYAVVELPQASPLFEDDGVLRLSMRHPLTLNPLLNQDATVARVLRLIFEPLITLDENFRPTSHLAEIEFASDFSSVMLEIRSDAFWSDGTPVTADDIIFSVNTLRSAPIGAVYRQNVENIYDITRLGTRSVQLHFANVTVYAASALNFPVIPQHHFRQQANSMTPIGNGAFKFDGYTPMRHIRLVQNPYTFRQRSQITEIEVIFLPDAQTELYAFDQGRIDALHLPLTEWARHHSVRHITHEIFPAMYFEFVGFNFDNEIFHNIQVRRGVSHAFNACQVVSDVYLNHAVRAASPIHPYYWAAHEATGIAYDPARARELLNVLELYYPLVIIVNDCNPQRVSIANRLAQSLVAVGQPARVESVHYTEYFARLESGDFDLFIGGVNLDFAPNVQFLFGGGFYIEDTLLEVMWNGISQAFSEAAYMQALEHFGQSFADRLPVIGLAFRHSAMLTNGRFVQAGAPSPDNVLGGVNKWARP